MSWVPWRTQFILSNQRLKGELITVNKCFHTEKILSTNRLFNLVKENVTETNIWKLQPDKFKLETRGSEQSEIVHNPDSELIMGESVATTVLSIPALRQLKFRRKEIVVLYYFISLFLMSHWRRLSSAIQSFETKFETFEQMHSKLFQSRGRAGRGRAGKYAKYWRQWGLHKEAVSREVDSYLPTSLHPGGSCSCCSCSMGWLQQPHYPGSPSALLALLSSPLEICCWVQDCAFCAQTPWKEGKMPFQLTSFSLPFPVALQGTRPC